MKSKTFPLAVLGLAVSMSPLTAVASTMEEVIITAQKREQKIEDVPLTVSALSGEELKNLGIDRFDNLSDLVPGLVVQQQSVNNNGYVIRGITSDDGSSTSAARVSVYLNGVDVSRSRGSYFEVYDMARVEVVKGPQATLFGTAASIGAISFITNKPEKDFSAEINATLGDYDRRDLGGYVTGGNDLVQGRLAFVTKKRDGYIDNNSAEDDLNGYERLSVRPSLRLTPNDELTIDLIYTHEEADDPGIAFSAYDSLFTGDLALSVPSSNVLGMDNLGVDRETDDFNVNVQWDFAEQWSMTYTGGWREHEALEVFDADGTEYEFLNFAEDAEGEQSSHELRMNFTGDTLNGFFGISYFTEEASQKVPFFTEEGLFLSCAGQATTLGISSCNPNTTAFVTGLLSGGTATVDAIPYSSSYTNRADNDALSVFADATWTLNPEWELTLGVRFVDEERTSYYKSSVATSYFATLLTGNPSDLFGGALHNTAGSEISDSVDDTAVLPRASLRWQITEQFNAYATVSKGQRSQVLDLSSGSSEVVPAEKIMNYEVGFKGSSLDNRLNYSLALFYQDYENFQVVLVEEDTGFLRSANAGTATNTGLELDASWQANDYLTLTGNLALIDAGIDDDADNGEYAGNQFRLQPETTGAIAALFRYPLTEGFDLTASTVWSYRSETYFDIENEYRESSVSLWNARIGLAEVADDWSVTVFADNLLDEEYIIDAGNSGSSFGYPTYIEGPPRMVGVTVQKRFH